MFNDKINEAVATIRSYCAKVKDCKKCRYIDHKGECPFMQETPPCDWEMGKRQEKEAGA